MLQHWTLSSSHSHSASRRQFPVTMMIVMLLGIIPHSVLPSSPPFVKDLPRHQKLILGNVNRFVLECRGDGDPRPVYTWYRGGELLTPERRQELGVSLISNEEHSQLEFPSPTNIQEGFYHCEARNDLGLAVSSVTRVSSLASPPPPGTSAPVWISPPKTEIKSLGSRVELDCEAEGSPEPEVVWTKNGEVIPEETSSSLIIPSLGEEDVANYACNASNIAGYEYKNVIVNILTIGAMIKEGPKPTLIASKGSDVVMRCDAEGFPRPVITWSVNGSEIRAGDKYRVDTETGALTVIQATMEDDGRYRCVARNQAEDSAEGHLIVKSVATIVRGPSDRTETLGSEVRMECEVVADTSVSLSVTWKKDNGDLGSGASSGERITVTEGDTAQSSILQGTGTYRTTLTIRMVSVQDEGIYTCVASQGPGRVTESGLLTVVGIEPRIQLPDKSSHLVLAGSSLLLPCPVSQGVPAPDVAWYHGSDEVTRGEVGADHSLAITTVTKGDAGLYTCKASNTEGSAKIMYSLEVSRSTSIVSDPIYIDLSATSGSSAVFPCDVDMDQILRAGGQQQQDQDYGDYKEQSLGSSFEVAWYKDYQELSPGFMEAALIMSETEVNSVDNGPCASASGEHSLYLLANSSLLVCGLGPEDVGSYHCEVNTSLGEVVRSQPSSVYLTAPFPWWIVIIIISLVIFLTLICVVCYCKRRRTGKGYYGMDIEDGINGGAHNKSDIYYTTEDNESIMDEMDQSMLEKQNGKTPIFTPKTIRRLARVDKSIGSIGSLLDDDEYLDKGYDEDGSFRERYAE